MADPNTWQDYLALSFDEIRQFGARSLQVERRLRAASAGLADTISVTEQRDAVLQYLNHLNQSVVRSGFDDQDQAAALQEERQGLGLSRKRSEPKDPMPGQKLLNDILAVLASAEVAPHVHEISYEHLVLRDEIGGLTPASGRQATAAAKPGWWLVSAPSSAI